MECQYVRSYADIVEFGSFRFTGGECNPSEVSRSIYLYPELVQAYHRHCRNDSPGKCVFVPFVILQEINYLRRAGELR